jgi:hypothetical protein
MWTIKSLVTAGDASSRVNDYFWRKDQVFDYVASNCSRANSASHAVCHQSGAGLTACPALVSRITRASGVLLDEHIPCKLIGWVRNFAGRASELMGVLLCKTRWLKRNATSDRLSLADLPQIHLEGRAQAGDGCQEYNQQHCGACQG